MENITHERLFSIGFIKGGYQANWFVHNDLKAILVQINEKDYCLETFEYIRISEPFRYIEQLQDIAKALNFKLLT